MLIYRKLKLNKPKSKISDTILNWSDSNQKFLNIISPPYNSTDILINVIMHYLFGGRRVIYITENTYNNVNLIRNIKLYSNRSIRDNFFKACDFKGAAKLNESYDLIIYDDLNTFPLHNRCDILNLLKSISYENSKFIICSIESMFKWKKEIVIPVKDDRKPLIEPRSIFTRVDISKDIPFIVFDYLRWSIKQNRKVIICVPNEDKITKVYGYISKYCNNITQNIVCIFLRHSGKVINNFKKLKNGVCITCSFDIFNHNIQDVDVMVYFADDPVFNYKKLVYICAGINRNRKNLEGEVIFLANGETYDMEKAKDITRKFNKEAWEKGLLRI